MKSYLLFPFIRWIVGKIFSKVVNLNRGFRETLRREPGFAAFFWVLGTVIFMCVVSVLGAAFIDSAEQFGWFVLAQFSVSLLYLAVNGVTIMYEAFKRDRQDLFNILKSTE